jgi:hypothetical protein
MRLTRDSLPAILVTPGEHPWVAAAVGDLAGDVAAILGRRPRVDVLDASSVPAVVVGSADNPAFARRYPALAGILRGRREACLATMAEGSLVLAGSDSRGAMWAVYRACAEDLGVDPLQAWTDHRPAQRPEVDLGEHAIESPAVALRGWFLNDEDLLSEWQDGGGRRSIDYPFYRQVVATPVIDRVITAALRLRLNLLIPASFLDLANPAEAALAQRAVARGLHVSQHHAEPLGVSAFALGAWAHARGLDGIPSYAVEPDRVRACWEESVRRWAALGDGVVWQLGLRGRGDRSAWHDDARFPRDPAARGAVISRAIADQQALVARVLGHHRFTATVTIWAELAGLHLDGHLAIPDGVVRVLCDHGPSRLWCGDYRRAHRDPARPAGTYTHVAYWGDGPHLVQGTSPARLAALHGEALARGDTAYALLNVGNLRETVLGAWHAAGMWWSGRAVAGEVAFAAWCAAQYPGADHAGLATIHRDFYLAWPDMGERHGASNFQQALDITAPDPDLVAGARMPLLDGAVRGKGDEVLRAVLAALDGRPAPSVHWGEAKVAIPWLAGLASQGAEGFSALIPRIVTAIAALPAGRRSFATAHLLVQAEIAHGLLAWMAALCAAWRAAAAGDRAGAADGLGRALVALDRALAARPAAERGEWTGWYRGDRKLDLAGLRSRTAAALEASRGLPRPPTVAGPRPP